MGPFGGMGRWRLRAAGAACVAAAVLAGAVPAGALTGGSPVTRQQLGKSGDYGWLVRLADENGTRCTATLIGAEWALTAAHCTGGSMSAYVGNATKPVAVVEQHVHPSWDSANLLDYDIAVLRLARASSAAPVRLARTTTAVRVGDSAELLGWGQTSSDASAPDPTSPSRGTAAIDHVTGTALSLAAATAAGCPGDSGGPVLDGAGVQIGVITSGSAECGTFTGAARTSSATEFVEAFLQANRPPSAVDGAIEAEVGAHVVIPLEYSDPDGDPLKIIDVRFTKMFPVSSTESPPSITVAAGTFEGTATLEYKVSDGIATATGTWTVQFIERRVRIDAMAVAEPRGRRTTVKVPVTLTVADDAPVTVLIEPQAVEATPDADFKAEPATITFAPGQTAAEYAVVVLADSLDEYDEHIDLVVTVLDGDAQTFTNTPRFTIVGNLVPVNNPPVVQGGEVWTTVNTPVDIPIEISDPDGDSMWIDFIGQNAEVVSCQEGTPPTCTFQPAADFVGDASVIFRVEDERGAVTEATWIIHVQP